jgi:trigger factor
MGRIPPAKVKRELRQEVNFGCAICGAPLVEYHHIVAYSEVEQHDPDHMVALCPNHHRLSDDGAISQTELYEAKKNPANSKKVDYDFYFDPNSPVIPLGSNVVEIGSFGRYRILQVDDEPIISVNYTDGRVEFDVNFYNEYNDLIAVITDNEWWADTNEFWDIKYQSNRLKLWNEKYEIGFLSEYDPEDSTISFRGRFLYDGDEFIIHPSSIKFPGDQGGMMKNVGVVIGSEEDYQPRISNVIASIINFTSASEGVFVVGETEDGFAFHI